LIEEMTLMRCHHRGQGDLEFRILEECDMRKSALFGAAVLALALSTSAHAVTFAIIGDTTTITFNGLGDPPGGGGKVVVPGLSASMDLTLASFNVAKTSFVFNYALTNTSTLAGTRISGIGFNIAPNATTVSSTGIFDTAVLPSNGKFVAGYDAEACFWVGGGDCPAASAGEGVAVGDTGIGTLTLNFASGLVGGVTLTDFLDRYQGFSSGGISSAVGEGTEGPIRNPDLFGAVPEPATWAMMILGFAFVGGAMRRRTAKQTLRFTYA
jgi:hypothetical protein